MMNQRLVRTVLAAAVVIVWVAVARVLFTSVAGDSPAEIPPNPPSARHVETAPPPLYTADVRDPFAPPRQVQAGRRTTLVMPIPPPDITILATMDGSALLYLPTGETVSILVGDTLLGARVSGIGPSFIQLRMGSERFTYTLE
jgi:hypothetical protein